MRLPIILLIIVFLTAAGFLYLSLSTSTPNPSIMTKNLRLISSSFENNTNLLSRFTCDGENLNPALSIAGVPPEAKSLVLIMDDPDAPGRTWVHWVRWNIPPLTTEITEGMEPAGDGAEYYKYDGPCPPSGTHRYIFKLFALDTLLDFNVDLDAIYNKKALLIGGSETPRMLKAAAVMQAMQGHILDQTELIGNYKRTK